jgi:hypothetical protein
MFKMRLHLVITLAVCALVCAKAQAGCIVQSATVTHVTNTQSNGAADDSCDTAA